MDFSRIGIELALVGFIVAIIGYRLIDKNHGLDSAATLVQTRKQYQDVALAIEWLSTSLCTTLPVGILQAPHDLSLVLIGHSCGAHLNQVVTLHNGLQIIDY